jgi:2,5-dihydroxypyridine 5,6-dioxygenase
VKGLTSLTETIEEALKLSKIKENEKTILVSSHIYDEKLLEKFEIALNNLGADFFTCKLPPNVKGKRLMGPAGSLALCAFKEADIVIDVISIWPPQVPSALMMPRKELRDILESGTRWLTFMIPMPEVNLRRLFPSEAMIKRTYSGAKLMQEAETIRITSDHGTDLTLNKKGRNGHAQAGVADKPGRWDIFGFGIVATAPIEDSANGTLVINTNDYIQEAGGMDMAVAEPVRCTIKDGYVTKIEGGSIASLLRRHLANYGNKESYGVSHIGWGTHEGAVWIDSGPLFCIADAESYLGNMQIAFGSNIFPPSPAEHCGGVVGWGKRESPSHIDLDLLEHDFYLDDELIVRKGIIVNPDCS